MYSLPIHLTHELILFIQFTRERVKFNGDSTVKSSCWFQAPTQIFLDLHHYHPNRIWPFSRLHTVGPHSSVASTLGDALQLPPKICPEHSSDFPRVCRPSAWLTCSCNGAQLLFLSAAPGVPKQSPIQWISRPNVHELELLVPTLHGLQAISLLWLLLQGLTVDCVLLQPWQFQLRWTLQSDCQLKK